MVCLLPNEPVGAEILLVAGRTVGRSKPESITLFKSVGLAIEDVALGGKLLAAARQQGVGKELPF